MNAVERAKFAMLRNTLREAREFVELYAERDLGGHAPGMVRQIDQVLRETKL